MPINKEAIRLLVIQHGIREGARIAGLNENTVLSWAHRYNWQPAIKTQSNGHSSLVERVSDDLTEHARQTKLGLATYAKRQAEHLASQGKLSDHGAFRNIASGASTLHGWNAEVKPSHFSLNVLNINTLSVDNSDNVTD